MSAKVTTPAELAAVIRKELGLAPGEPLRVYMPQFTRPPGEPGPAASPADEGAFERLKDLPKQTLRELGLRPWGRRDIGSGMTVGPELWLFPAEWYNAIPPGFELVSIQFKREKFQPGVTDNDMRFGLLAYGILKSDPSDPPDPDANDEE